MTAKRKHQPDDEKAHMPLDHLLRQAQRRLDACQRQVLAPLRLTPRQVEVLAALKGRGGMHQRDLARRVDMDASTLAELARRLDGRGLIRRAPHRKDRRALALYLTPKGRRMLQKALPLMQRADAMFLKDLQARQRHSLINALTTLATTACNCLQGEAADEGEKCA